MSSHPDLQVNPALVTRVGLNPHEPEQYLLVTGDGLARWTTDPATATAFASMREATRAALRLPGSLRAFGIPSGPAKTTVH